MAGGVTKNYVAGIEYTDANLEAIYHAEGRCVPNGATAFYYEYTIKDHLGNARVNFRANGTTVTFLEELHYYPFGMLMEGIGTTAVTANAYKYNLKELNTDLGLNWYDYGARWYDPAVGRWWSVDLLAEKYVGWSPYIYGLDNPVKFIDPNGMNVIVTTSEKKGKEHIHIEFNGVLVNQTGGHISKRQMRSYRREIRNQIKAAYTGESSKRSWDIDVNLRIGKEPKGIGEKKENTINLIKEDGGSSDSKGGFQAFVNINTGVGTVGSTAAHEVGHNMGLPHVLRSIVKDAPLKYGVPTVFPDYNLVTTDNPLSGNLMMPGPAPAEVQGTNIAESQILHIRNDYNNGQLNREDVNGGDSAWGNMPTDRPVYDFIYLNLLKVQILAPRDEE